MVSAQQLNELITLIDAEDRHGQPWGEEAFARLGTLVAALQPHTKYPAPVDSPAAITGRWETLFAHFGARHSAGKPKVHDSNLKVHSFNRFPPSPVRVLRMCQEIDAATAAYNNVVDIAAPGPDGSAVPGTIIVFGRYRAEDADRQRFDVDFYRVALRPGPGVSEAAFRSAIAFGAADPLEAELKPPRLHSNVVYLDDLYRINVGSLGGLYVLRRLDEPALSY
jgi:hypothetical protein